MRNLTPQQKQKLVSIYPELQSWFDAQSSISSSTSEALLMALLGKIQQLKGDDGEDGTTPVKGKDYFTSVEIDQIINYAAQLAKPIKGKDYFDADNYVLTPADKRDIARSINVPIVEKIIEKVEVVREVSPKSIDVSLVKGAASKKDFDSIAKKVESGMAVVDGRIKLIDQRWRGGGLSRVSHDSTLSGDGTPSNPLSVNGSSSGYQVPLTGVVNGVNKVFTWATAPNAIVVDNGSTINKQNITPDSTVNWTGTTSTTLTVAPTFNIFSVA